MLWVVILLGRMASPDDVWHKKWAVGSFGGELSVSTPVAVVTKKG